MRRGPRRRRCRTFVDGDADLRNLVVVGLSQQLHIAGADRATIQRDSNWGRRLSREQVEFDAFGKRGTGGASFGAEVGCHAEFDLRVCRHHVFGRHLERIAHIDLGLARFELARRFGKRSRSGSVSGCGSRRGFFYGDIDFRQLDPFWGCVSVQLHLARAGKASVEGVLDRRERLFARVALALPVGAFRHV